MFGDADFQLQQVEDILRNKLTKRNVMCASWTCSHRKKSAAIRSSRSSKSKTALNQNWPKKIQKLIKKQVKVQAAIQGDAVRITGAKRDDLQAAMALIRKELPDHPLSFNNFRD